MFFVPLLITFLPRNCLPIKLTVEDHLMPKVKNYSLCFVTRKSDDQKLLVQYEKFKDVTLEDIWYIYEFGHVLLVD